MSGDVPDEEGLGESPDPEQIASEEAELNLSPAQIDLHEREIRAVELRKAGHSFFEIAQALGFSNKGAAWKAVRRALQRWGAENVAELRQLEVMRLDTITRKLWPKILGQKARPGGVDEEGNVVEPRDEIPPDMDAMRLYLQVSARRSRLLGLDAAIEVALPGSEEPADTTTPILDDLEQYERLIEEISSEVVDVEPIYDDDGREGGGESEGGGAEGGVAADDPVLPARPDEEP